MNYKSALLATLLFSIALSLGVSDANKRDLAKEKIAAQSKQITELRDQINQLNQQMIVVTAKLEGRPQTCGVRDWLTFDGSKQ